MKAKELRELTCEVTNPDHDKRCKYGSRAIGALPAGTRFIVYFYGPEDGALNGLPQSVLLNNSKGTCIDYHFGRLMFDCSKTVPITTVDDVRAHYGVNPDSLIRELVAQSAVTIEQLCAAAQAVQDRWAQEEANAK